MRVTVEFSTGNAMFEELDSGDIAAVLGRQITERLHHALQERANGADYILWENVVRDVNGNRIGHVTIEV